MNSQMWSQGSGKLSGISSLNSDTTSNPFCQKMSKTKNTICSSCYSWSMLKTFRKNCVPKFKQVGEYLSKIIHPAEYLPRCNSPVGRFHSHGELINTIHCINLFNICYNQPTVTFALWTKRTNLVYEAISEVGKPSNLILIYSNAKLDNVMKSVPKHFDKVFNNVTRDGETVNCHSKCLDCMKCYTLEDKTQQIVEVVK
tara:strand:- start:5732 stop:6328 length:597 start_codon:yes stop_codon:yes gene_type:complete